NSSLLEQLDDHLLRCLISTNRRCPYQLNRYGNNAMELTAYSREPIDPLLKDRECAALLSMSVPTFWRRVADGTVPKPIKLGGLSRWAQSEIIAVIDAAKALRKA